MGPGGFSLDAAAAQYYTAAQHYASALEPYALKLFFGLFLIDLLVTFIQYTADGGMDPMSYLGRFIRQLMGAGFVLAMLIYGFQWMTTVINSFGQLGRIITGLPPISPDSIGQAGLNLALTIWNSPTTGGLISSLKLAIIEAFLGGVVLGAFVWVAGELLLTLVRGYLIIALGVIVLAFGGNRFTSRAAEGYFSTVLRIGIKILFFYAVLAIGMQLVAQWEVSLLAACHPTTTSVPWMTSYFTPPTAMMTTVCTGTISLLDMAMYALLAVLFLLTCVGIPRMASELIGGPLGHALEDLASAYYLGRTLASPPLRPAARALRGTVNGAIEGGKEAWRRRYPSQQTMQSFAADVAAQARARSAAQPTKALSPFNGKQPGYNMRNAYGVQVTQPLNPQAQNMGAKPTNKI